MLRSAQLCSLAFVLIGFALPAMAQPPEALSPQQQQILQMMQQSTLQSRLQAPLYMPPPAYNGPQFAAAPPLVPRQQVQMSAQGCLTVGPWQGCYGTNGYNVQRGSGFNAGLSRDANGQADPSVGYSWTGPSIIAPTASVGYNLGNNNLQICGGVDAGFPNPIDPTQRLISVSGQLCGEGSLGNRPNFTVPTFTVPTFTDSSGTSFGTGSSATPSGTPSGTGASGTIFYDDNAPRMNTTPVAPRQPGQSAPTAAARW